MEPKDLDHRLSALESRLARLETLLERVSETLSRSQVDAETAKDAIKTDRKSTRLNSSH